ncbi:hypothetical protein CAPTEDRAFT_221706 [Capitella teleta]|uniref:Rho-GAP domain-containing protein n=1 Tax=Capitella teleta TaxID=283909 RepID=R7TET2_CAPTE|nr:hypothetical protein CAPTEDRAFT_221706 [Capitella teleta]|eukprot:ELT92239.1 hypothetical protein CAPTEDRAFT_221706 [Capitella teleta]
MSRFTNLFVRRAEKTEVLNEDLQLLDKRVESIQRSCSSLHRKMKEFLASAGTGADVEKKLKKMPESHLSSSLIESGTILGEETLMGSSMVLCGDTEGHMARERLQLEIDLENQVLTPIANVIEVDIPNIHKIKKHLKQHILDMDAAKARHLSAIKQQQQGNIGLGKLDSVREEMEEAQNKVDLARDQLSTEMFSLLARESDFSKILYDMITVQSQYHMRALETLNRTLPQLQEQIDCNLHTPVYGQPLEDHLTRTGREIAMVLEDCCCALINSGLDEEGLFRIAGGASKVKKLKAAFDSGMVDMDEYARDPHSVAGALKQYLRELPEPLLTYEYYNEWMRAAHLPNETRLQTLWCIVEKLPKENYNNLRYLIKFMSKLAEKSALNKMTESNIAIVLGPNLIWPPGDGGPSVLTTGTQSGIVEALISNANWFFPGDVHFNCTVKGSSPPTEHRKTSLLNSLQDATASSSNPEKSPSGKLKKSSNSVGKGLSMVHSAITTPLHSGRDTSSATDLQNSSAESDSNEGKMNGRAASLGEGIGERVVVTPVTPVKRAVTPPPLPAPAKSIHSDMYNTVFALHSLGDDSWSDYLTRVRGLWDGHMNKRLSSSVGTPPSTGTTSFPGMSSVGTPSSTGVSSVGTTSSPGVSSSSTPSSTGVSSMGSMSSPGMPLIGTPSSTGVSSIGTTPSTDKSSMETPSSTEISSMGNPSPAGASSTSATVNGGKDVEFSLSSSSQGSSPAGTLRGPANIDLDNPVLPYPVNPPISIAPVIAPPQASPPPPAPAISSNNNLSTESLDNNLSSVSPKAPRRTKKTAPPPPEKPSLTPAPPPATAEKPEASLYPSLTPLLTDKPSRPNAPPPSSSEPPPASPNFQDPPSPRVERPRGPPPDRPMGPPPDKPEKPPMLNNTLPRASKPMKPEKPSVSPDVLSCTDDKPPVAAKPDGPTHQRTASGSLKADSLPRGEGLGHQRLPSTGGTKPPRPQPPPPPPPRTSSSKGDEPESKESAVSTYL